MTHTVRVALVGLGNVGRALLDLMISKAGTLRDQYGLALVLTGAADSSGAVLDAQALAPGELRAHKSSGGGAGNFRGGQAGMSAPQMVELVAADVLVETAAVNLQNGRAGL
jgi:homoserine dehydrogenase